MAKIETPFEELFSRSLSAEAAQQEETAEEVVNEQVEEAAKEEVVEQKAEVVEQPSKVEIKDEDVLSYIASKTGKEAKSFEELFAERQLDPKDVFASEDLVKINDFVKTTGRGISEYLELQKIESTELSDADKVKMKLAYDNPNLSQSEIDLLFRRQYKKVELHDDMDESEKAAALEENTFTDILLKKEANIANKFVEELKQKYYTPVKSQEQASYDVGKYKELWDTSSKTIGDISFEVTKDKTFNWVVDDAEKKFFENPITPDSFVKEYIKADGSWDMAKWAKDLYVIKNLSRIIQGAAASRSSEGVEELIDSVKDAKGESTTTASASGQSLSLAKAMFGKY
jgi:hypothetical protein